MNKKKQKPLIDYLKEKMYEILAVPKDALKKK